MLNDRPNATYRHRSGSRFRMFSCCNERASLARSNMRHGACGRGSRGDSSTKSQGRLAPTNVPTITIVASGPYRFTLNPIYLGMFPGLIGLAIALDNPWLLMTLMTLVPFALVIRYGEWLARKPISGASSVMPTLATVCACGAGCSARQPVFEQPARSSVNLDKESHPTSAGPIGAIRYHLRGRRHRRLPDADFILSATAEDPGVEGTHAYVKDGVRSLNAAIFARRLARSSYPRSECRNWNATKPMTAADLTSALSCSYCVSVD